MVDLSKFESGTLTITKTQAPQASVVVNLRVFAPTGADPAELWKTARAEILADPAVAGLKLDEKAEDVNLGLSPKRSVNAVLRFLAPKA